MKSLTSSIELISKRPFLFVYISTITLILCIIEYFNPVFGIISGMSKLGGSGLIDSYFIIIQLVLKPVYYPMMVLYLFIALICCSLLISLFLTGYFYGLNNAIENKEHVRGEFFKGMKKYFFRVFFLTLALSIIFVIFIVAIIIAVLPAVMLLKGAIAGTENIAFAIFVTVVTAFTIFFAIMFFEIYLSFMFPSVFCGEKKPYFFGKKVADKAFFGMIIPMTVFTAVLIDFQIGMTYMNIGIFQIVLNWAVKTLFVSLFIGYIFVVFNKKRVEVQ